MGNLTSEYTIDLQIKDDKSKDAIRELEKSLKGIGETFKTNATGEELTKSLEKSQEAAQAMIDKFHEMAKEQDLDFKAVSKAYSRNAGKAISELEKQYAELKEQLDDEQKKFKENETLISELKKKLNDTNVELSEQTDIAFKLNRLEKEQADSKVKQLEAQVQQNRQIRANLKAAEQSARMERANTKYKKLEELYVKRKAATDKSEKKSLDEKIKQQKAYIKSIEQAEKITKKTTEQTGKLGKAWESVLKHMNRIGKVTQFATNTAINIGGAARTAIGAGKMAFNVVSGAIGSVASGAEREVERERQAARIKGNLSEDEKKKLLQQVYIRTGADYGAIVDAINAVQNTFGKNVKPDELAQAAAMDIQYPGTASTFLSSTEGESNMEKFNMYANRLKAIQSATGASVEQIQASTEFVSKYANHDTGASVSQLQAVYLAMQNQGAFNSEEELQTAFKSFVKQQANSGMSPVEFAQKFDWSSFAKGSDARNRATNALKTMDWKALNSAATTQGDNATPKMSDAETMAIKMREVEEKKNQLVMKLIPAVLPVVEGIAKLMDSKGDKIVNGMVKLFETVIPMLDPIFSALGVFLDFMSETILPLFQKLVTTIVDWFGDDDEQPQYANGGITSMPSIVGERGPEAIIPLDFSRAARANNVETSITQTFNMTGNQTTALSLSQAVRSRDFTRAMTDNLFITNRCGGF